MPLAHGLNLVRDITLTTLVGTAPSFLLLDRPATATVTTIVSNLHISTAEQAVLCATGIVYSRAQIVSLNYVPHVARLEPL